MYMFNLTKPLNKPLYGVCNFPPAMQETWVQSLGWEDPQEEGMATRSSFLAWRIPWAEDPGGLQSWGRKEKCTIEQLNTTAIFKVLWSALPHCLQAS